MTVVGGSLLLVVASCGSEDFRLGVGESGLCVQCGDVGKIN